jgi:hypothetical protein
MAHEHKDLKGEVLDIINNRRDPNFLTYSPVKRFAITIADILEAAGELAYTVRDENELATALEDTFDVAAKEIDIPFLGDAQEVMMEAMARQLIRPAVHLIYARLNPQS